MMAMLFAQRVILGKTEFDAVPAKLKKQVADILTTSAVCRSWFPLSLAAPPMSPLNPCNSKAKKILHERKSDCKPA